MSKGAADMGQRITVKTDITNKDFACQALKTSGLAYEEIGSTLLRIASGTLAGTTIDLTSGAVSGGTDLGRKRESLGSVRQHYAEAKFRHEAARAGVQIRARTVEKDGTIRLSCRMTSRSETGELPSAAMTSTALTCADCSASFEFTSSEREFFETHGFSPPRRCGPCRQRLKEERALRPRATPVSEPVAEARAPSVPKEVPDRRRQGAVGEAVGHAGPDEKPKLRDRPIDEREASLRGQVVEMFARLERALDSIISLYYVPEHPLSTYLWMDLLAAEGFSYGLRREVFEAIVRRHNLYDGKKMDHLHKVGRWRNFFAHVAGMQMHEYGDDPTVPKKIGYRDPKHPHKTLTIQEAFDDFKAEWEKADDYVSEVAAECFPLDRFCVGGHIVLDPIPPEERLDAPWSEEPPKLRPRNLGRRPPR